MRCDKINEVRGTTASNKKNCMKCRRETHFGPVLCGNRNNADSGGRFSPHAFSGGTKHLEATDRWSDQNFVPRISQRRRHTRYLQIYTQANHTLSENYLPNFLLSHIFILISIMTSFRQFEKQMAGEIWCSCPTQVGIYGPRRRARTEVLQGALFQLECKKDRSLRGDGRERRTPTDKSNAFS